MKLTVGVLALQGAFFEHLKLLQYAAIRLKSAYKSLCLDFDFIGVRNEQELSRCDALIIPGGESTTISLVAAQSNLLEPLRDFVKIQRKPTWGTCAGLILLAEAANQTKKGGQELIGGLDVRVNRNHFGRQVESFQADLELPFLGELNGQKPEPYPGVFIRAPIVEKLLPQVPGEQVDELEVGGTVLAPSKQTSKVVAKPVQVLGILPGRLKKAEEQVGANVATSQAIGDIIAVKQGNVFGTSFHPELTPDIRIHLWWLREVIKAVESGDEHRHGSESEDSGRNRKTMETSGGTAGFVLPSDNAWRFYDTGCHFQSFSDASTPVNQMKED
jgi:5'-phosphate synthase pdxT subunit